MIDLPANCILRFDLNLPTGAMVRDGDTFTFCCVGHAPDEIRDFWARFKPVNTEPPTLLDLVRGEMVELCTVEQWQQIVAEDEQARRAARKQAVVEALAGVATRSGGKEVT